MAIYVPELLGRVLCGAKLQSTMNQKWTATGKTVNPSRWMQPISRKLLRFQCVPHHGADPNVPAARRIMLPPDLLFEPSQHQNEQQGIAPQPG